MSSISHINNIMIARGPIAAAAYAAASVEFAWVGERILSGDWDPNKKPEPTPAPRYAKTPDMRRPARRAGKTAKTGGLAASQRRKRERSLADQKLRASMKGK